MSKKSAKKPGRKALPKHLKRSVVSIRLNPDETAATKKAAAKAGVGFSEFIREATRRAAGLPATEAKAKAKPKPKPKPKPKAKPKARNPRKPKAQNPEEHAPAEVPEAA